MCGLCERKETWAHLTFLIWGFSFAEQFRRALLRAAEYRRFPLTSADQGFAFTLFSLLFSGYILFCVFYEKSDGTSLYPGKIIHAAGQIEPQPSSRVSMKFGRTKMEVKLKTELEKWGIKHQYTPTYTPTGTYTWCFRFCPGRGRSLYSLQGQIVRSLSSGKSQLNPQDYENKIQQMNFLGGKKKKKKNRHQHFLFFRKGWELFKDEDISPNADAIKVILKRSTSIDNLASWAASSIKDTT